MDARAKDQEEPWLRPEHDRAHKMCEACREDHHAKSVARMRRARQEAPRPSLPEAPSKRGRSLSEPRPAPTKRRSPKGIVEDFAARGFLQDLADASDPELIMSIWAK